MTLRARAAAALGGLRSARAGYGRGAPTEREMDRLTLAAQRDVEDSHNMRRLLAFTLQADSNCIDIGANHGAVLAEICRVSPAGRHVAFEPLPHLCSALREAFPNVDIHQAALSNRAGEADFAYVHGPSDGWSGLLFRPPPSGSQADVEHIDVRLEVLDPDYVPALVKIDVEGAEQQVIEGAVSTVRRHRPVVIFEHGLGSANVYGTHPADIYRLLCDEARLRIFDLDGGGPYTLSEFERTYDACERVNFVARA
jgi:FkbM family methyltransferase